jgi:TetR/AcrR family transcriptional repressor of nem operon
MSDVSTAIMDAAEKRMRIGGFNGFSFRDIATEVGVKSSSVHYHFPTKENLAAAVIRRYTETFAERLEEISDGEPDVVKRWAKAFKSTIIGQRMCPCTVLGAGAADLPPDVATEVRRFYRATLEMMAADGLSQTRAAELLATLTGAMVMANALDDNKIFDRAVFSLIGEGDVEAKR